MLPHLHRTLQFIKSSGRKAGVALNPSTPVGALEEIAGDVDYVLVMSVNPGFGGQTFIPRSESKVRAVRALLDRAGNRRPIEVDGGVDATNAARHRGGRGRASSSPATPMFAGGADPERDHPRAAGPRSAACAAGRAPP